MGENSTTNVTPGYGAGPVSVQLTRGRPLVEAPVDPRQSPVELAPPRPARDRSAYDRLALKHWPRGHRVLVCSLTGGTGRTTVAALLAATLTGLPYAHIWPPALLVETTRDHHRSHSGETTETDSTRAEDELVRLLPAPSPVQVRTTESGITLLQPIGMGRPGRSTRQLRTAVTMTQDRFAPVIIDNLAGWPSDSPWTRDSSAGFSVVLVVRPDEYSLIHAGQVLVWLHDQHWVSKQQVIVVVNYGVGPPTSRSRPAAAALAVRCHGLHHLPADPRLGPGPTPPTSRPVPARLRLRLAQIGLDIWHTSQTPNPRPQEIS